MPAAGFPGRAGIRFYFALGDARAATTAGIFAVAGNVALPAERSHMLLGRHHHVAGRHTVAPLTAGQQTVDQRPIPVHAQSALSLHDGALHGHHLAG